MIENANHPFLIAGLGNPGVKFRKNRHNVGFMTLDRLALQLGIQFSRMELKSLIAKGSFQNRRIVLGKPFTYMNLSGQAVGGLLRYYQIPLEQLLVVIDDVDLPLGMLRLRPGGGSGGHKGLVSIIERLNTQDFPRLRIGVGRPPGRMEAADFVLQDFSPDEKQLIDQALFKAVEAIQVFISEDLNTAMNRFNFQAGSDEQ